MGCVVDVDERVSAAGEESLRVGGVEGELQKVDQTAIWGRENFARLYVSSEDVFDDPGVVRVKREGELILMIARVWLIHGS